MMNPLTNYYVKVGMIVLQVCSKIVSNQRWNFCVCLLHLGTHRESLTLFLFLCLIHDFITTFFL